jgi:hypothetical protein
MTNPFWVCAAVTVLSAATSAGFSILAVVSADEKQRTVALYACARSLSLLISSLAPLVTRSTSWLEAVACTMILIQACDAAIGAMTGDRMKTYGPAGVGALNLAVFLWLLS